MTAPGAPDLASRSARRVRQLSDPPPSLCIVVPHYGDPEPTVRLVRQLSTELGSTHETPSSGQAPSTGVGLARVDIIVVDDASPTALPDIAGATVIRRPVNGGFGAAVNTGARAGRGDLLLILNSDLELAPTVITDLVAASARWQPAVTGPVIRDLAGHAAYSGRHFPTARHQVTEWLTPLARYRHHRLLHEAVGHDTRAVPGATVSVDWLVGAALLLPRADFLAVGGFDERFYMNSEEIDLQRRLRARGLPSIFLGEVGVRHEGGGSSDPGRRRQWLVDSRFRYAAKWGGGRRLRTGLHAATAVNLAANLIRRGLGNRAVEPLATAHTEWRLIRGGER